MMAFDSLGMGLRGWSVNGLRQGHAHSRKHCPPMCLGELAAATMLCVLSGLICRPCGSCHILLAQSANPACPQCQHALARSRPCFQALVRGGQLSVPASGTVNRLLGCCCRRPAFQWAWRSGAAAPCSADDTGSLDDAPHPLGVWVLEAGSEATTASCGSALDPVCGTLGY